MKAMTLIMPIVMTTTVILFSWSGSSTTALALSRKLIGSPFLVTGAGGMTFMREKGHPKHYGAEATRHSAPIWGLKDPHSLPFTPAPCHYNVSTRNTLVCPV